MVQQRILHPFRRFLQTEQASGMLLICCAAFSIIIANTNLGNSYQQFWKTTIGFGIGFISLKESVLYWVNDGLMAVFFLVVGLEIKRELLVGELATPKKALLPVVAACGGMLIPAAIYALFNTGKVTAIGWGIPMATDIAFALGVLALVGKRVPLSLKVFLIALAVIDDLGAIMIIAIFYSHHIAFAYLAFAAVVFLLLLVANKLKVDTIGLYLILGILLWYCLLHSGIHAAIAGVLVALTIPMHRKNGNPLLASLEGKLHVVSAFCIMPVFALANTAIAIDGTVLQSYFSPISYGIIVGLVLGKPVGIVGFSWLASRMGIVQLPIGANWKNIIGIGFLGGIGFTMSIFITVLAFSAPDYQFIAKIAILTASLVSAVIGYILLK